VHEAKSVEPAVMKITGSGIDPSNVSFVVCHFDGVVEMQQ